jgi:carboxypeptidase T
MSLFHVRITAQNREKMLDLVRKYHIDVARNTAVQKPTGYCICAHADDSQILTLETAGYEVERIEDAGQAGKSRQKELMEAVGKAVSSAEHLAMGKWPHYLSVPDVEKTLAIAAAPPSDAFVKLLKLPYKTPENRACSAIRIGKGSGGKRPGIFLLGGVHAREWGSPDILINFLAQLIPACRNHAGITIGSNSFSAAQIKHLIEDKDIFVFPQANPDGRYYSMTQDSMWRKNRRVLPQPGCVGVDINRNYDFLWNYPQYFSPTAAVQNSTNPADYQVYIGPAAASEAETKNVVWIFDSFPNIGYFIDLHSYSESILFGWGDDDDQSTDPHMNFHNSAYDGKRGIIGDGAYKEYIDPADKAAALKLANTLREAIKGVRGRVYKVEPSVDLYPTAGVSTDYAYARHLVNQSKAKVKSFTIEWGSQQNPTPFHPPYPEMQKIIQEITAALLAFCIAAT